MKPYGMTLLTFLPNSVETITIDFSITEFSFNCSLPSTLISVEDDPKFVTTSDQQSK